MQKSNNMAETEEEILLYLEFNGMLHEDIFNEKNIVFKTIGFDSDKPVLQIGDEFYEGEYDYSKGTNVFFEKDPNPIENDEIFDKKLESPVKYSCKTNKMLRMNRIFLKEKDNLGNNKNNEKLDDKKHFELSESYSEALDKLSEIVIKQLENNEDVTGVEQQ